MSRDGLVSELHRRNIGTGVHYRAIPVHPVYQRLFGWQPNEVVGASIVSVPLASASKNADSAFRTIMVWIAAVFVAATVSMRRPAAVLAGLTLLGAVPRLVANAAVGRVVLLAVGLGLLYLATTMAGARRRRI